MPFNPPKIDTGKTAKELSNPIAQAVLLVIIIALFSWFVVGPKYRTMHQNGVEATTVLTQKKQLEKEQQELADLMQKIEKSDTEIAVTNEALPLQGRISSLYSLLSSLVKNSSMNLQDLISGNTSTTVAAADSSAKKDGASLNRTLVTTEVTMNVTGTMDQLKNLLQAIETNPRLLDIEGVEVNSTADGSQFRVQLKAYSYIRK